MAMNARQLLVQEEFLIKEQADEIIREINIMLNATHLQLKGNQRVSVGRGNIFQKGFGINYRNVLIRIRNNAKRIIKASRIAQKFL